MSTMAYTDSDQKLYKNPTIHWRNNSGELDVFEASRYFSGSGAEVGAGFTSATNVPHKGMKDERPIWVGGRKSLDVPLKTSLPTHSHRLEKQIKEKKCKQPSSPGGRLASFLNSLFSQRSSKKKSKSTTHSMKGDEESHGGRRRRRSSISHFQSSSSSADAKSIYSSSTSSGFRTPPPYSNSKLYKQAVSSTLSKGNDHLQKPVSFCPQNKVLNEKREMGVGWFDEKFKLRDGFFENRIYIDALLEKDLSYSGNGFLEKGRKEEVEDGAESDSSSDLFELQNYDLGFYSNGLPVYETTHIESIKRGVPIVSGTH